MFCVACNHSHLLHRLSVAGCVGYFVVCLFFKELSEGLMFVRKFFKMCLQTNQKEISGEFH